MLTTLSSLTSENQGVAATLGGNTWGQPRPRQATNFAGSGLVTEIWAETCSDCGIGDWEGYVLQGDRAAAGTLSRQDADNELDKIFLRPQHRLSGQLWHEVPTQAATGRQG